MTDSLYPEIEPYNTDRVPVSVLHTLYMEEAGNPDGFPVVFLHGGPGSGIKAVYRRFFDPKFYRIILIDQRGAGRSTPFAELRDNTTDLLLHDLEDIRENLGIERWLLFGGSWGATLALTYAIRYPKRTAGMILRGVFLGTEDELHWFTDEDGAGKFYPDEYKRFLSILSEKEKSHVTAAYYRRLTSKEASVRREAVTQWNRWENVLSRIEPKILYSSGDIPDPDKTAAIACIECHYSLNHFFLPYDGFIMDNIDRIKDIPTHIVQGRYDIICPPQNAWLLHEALNGSVMDIVQTSGHSATEPETIKCLVRATEMFKRKLV